ncbi:hypothetical protein F2Q68_00035161 [Brassica cretica]|uniref:Uncharacterized protein n=1 Tax=Brassica cretica TaxID=69181 RepID=A0A8S9H1S4_BRACR|nr:hypothetical protein F2Q68_00035161 [Brassica cretica]
MGMRHKVGIGLRKPEKQHTAQELDSDQLPSGRMRYLNRHASGPRTLWFLKTTSGSKDHASYQRPQGPEPTGSLKRPPGPKLIKTLQVTPGSQRRYNYARPTESPNHSRALEVPRNLSTQDPWSSDDQNI